MQWTSGPNAGFSAPDTPKLWLPLATNYEQVNVEGLLTQPDSILNLYRRLLAYRKTSPALMYGNYHPIDSVPEDCYVYLRETEGQRILVALNFVDEAQQLSLPELGRGNLVISTHLDREELVLLDEFSLRPNEGVLVELAVS